MTGFTGGIAVSIFSSEVKDPLGLRMGAVPAPFLEKWAAFARAFGSVARAALLGQLPEGAFCFEVHRGR